MNSGPRDVNPTMLTIRLLGAVDLRSDETPLPPLESARAVSLLGYLLVKRGMAQPRQRVAFLLWPDSTEQQARTNLRHVLHTLRRALPGADRFIEATPTHAPWRADAPYRLDLDEFERRWTPIACRPRSTRTPVTCWKAVTTSGSSRSASDSATATDALERLGAGSRRAGSRRGDAVRRAAGSRRPLPRTRTGR